MSSRLVRLNKLLADKGLCSRREADRYITKGLVRVNGQTIDQLGTKVEPHVQIDLMRDAQRQLAQQSTILLHKPLGIVSCQPERPSQIPAIQLCTGDREYQPTSRRHRRPPFASHRGVVEPRQQSGWAVAGRLDVNSTGLLVLTQSGRVARQLLSGDIEKEYLVRIPQLAAETALEDKMAELLIGMHDSGEVLRAKEVERINEDQLRVVLHDGKHHHIRRMAARVGWTAAALKRVRIGDVCLGDLPIGQWRHLQSHERFGA